MHPLLNPPLLLLPPPLLLLLLLQVLHPLAMQPAIRSQNMDVRVKNSYNRQASGTIISKTRDMNCSLVTSIVLKNNVTLVDIVSSRMLGQYGALQLYRRQHT
jgi:aspartate kinase